MISPTNSVSSISKNLEKQNPPVPTHLQTYFQVIFALLGPADQERFFN